MIRLLSGVTLAAATLAAILFLPIVALRALASLVAVLAAHEFLRIAKSPGAAPMVAVGLTCWFVSAGSTEALMTTLVLVLGLVAVSVLFANETVQYAATGAFASVYIGMPLGMLAAVQTRYGARATLLLIATVVVSDSAQYYSGRLLGRRPLAPAISPKKTIEGAVGGVVIGTVFLMLTGPRVFPGAEYATMAVLGVIVVLLGICGDLFESRIKRAAGVKDSSALIPGHGGVLDRIDALLFAAPAFYIYLGYLGAWA